ncbi:MAG: glutathione S-transferase [Burkholderiales bacterium]|nr:glutathione S-transferase [Burkholderiales bacterium]
MIELHGLAISNYYNKAKLALLEKGIPFKEVSTKKRQELGEDGKVAAYSPLAKIPFIVTEQGGICESSVILEYLEDAYPENPLLPADPYQAAKVRELATFIDWHLEICARQLYSAAFFGGKPLSEANAARIRSELETRIAAFKRLARFSPYVAGDTFSMADCSAFASLSLVAMATKAIYGEDLLAAGGVDHKAYTKFIGERPAAQKVLLDRKEATSRL